MQNQSLTEEPAPAYVPFAAPLRTTPETDTLAATAETQAVTALFAKTKRKVRRRKLMYWIPISGMYVHMVFQHLWPNFWRTPYFTSTKFGVLAVMLTALASLLYTTLAPINLNVDDLVKIGGVRAIPTLLYSVTNSLRPGQFKIIYQALTQLLPQMQASDAHLLTTFHRRTLNNLLRWQPSFGASMRNEPAFTIAVLKAYEQVGDAKAIPVVEKLANYEGKNERKRKVREAARQCLPLLQSHLGELNTTQTLLRASSPSPSAPDVLLRPAAEVLPVPAGELLRAVENESSPD